MPLSSDGVLSLYGVRACVCCTQNGTAPSTGDILEITFNNPMAHPPVNTQALLDGVLIFRPPVTNVTYYGRWKDSIDAQWRVLEVVFDRVVRTPYPTLADTSLSIGELEVSINPAATLKSRDNSSQSGVQECVASDIMLTSWSWS
jgi:hypothetical protein